MREVLLANAGIKGQGLQRLHDLGILIPATVSLRDIDDVAVFLQNKRNWGNVDRWIVRPSPVAPEDYAPTLSGLFPSHVVPGPQHTKPILVRLSDELHSEDATTQLSLGGVPSPQLVFLLQPYLVAAISGIAHVAPFQDPYVTWTDGPLAPLAEGKISGYPLTVRMQPNPMVIRAPANQYQHLVQHKAFLLRAVASLNLTRRLRKPSEIEWLVSESGDFYGLQCQPLGRAYLDV